MASKDNRTRSWTFILYPESAPANWKEIIDEWHIEWAQSPLHDKDLNATGEAKKPHWHIMLLFGGVKSYDQVFDLTQQINGTVPQRTHNVRAMVRYMAHLDNPDKVQYSVSEIVGYGGIDIAELLKPASSERYTLVKEMVQFVRDNEIIEFKDLMDYAVDNRYDDWFPLLCDNSTIMISNYIKSCRHRVRIVDAETGEIRYRKLSERNQPIEFVENK